MIKDTMAEHAPPQDIDYESLGGGSLTSNLVAGAFAGVMVGKYVRRDLEGTN